MFNPVRYFPNGWNLFHVKFEGCGAGSIDRVPLGQVKNNEATQKYCLQGIYDTSS